MPKKATKDILFGAQNNNLNIYKALRELCPLSKIYNIRQYYFTEKKFLGYNSNYHLYKNNKNYVLLNRDLTQQTIKVIDRNFKF